MTTIRERADAWAPRCQFIKSNRETAAVRGHPWPISVLMADGYHLLCKRLERDHPRTFVGPEWNHDVMVYDASLDPSPEADRRALLVAGDALAEAGEWARLMVTQGGPDGSDLDYAVWDEFVAALARWREVTGER